MRAGEIALGVPLAPLATAAGPTTGFADPTVNPEPQTHSSDDGKTLADREKDEKMLEADGEKSGIKRSANSSMDHLADLGGPRGVSVRRGKEEFQALERRYSNLSQHSQDLQRTGTRRSTRSGAGFAPAKKVDSAETARDVEKGKQEEEEFDLADVLKTQRDKSDEAGIRHKQVGVVWEDLEVIGAGGLKINIRNFSSAIIEQFLMPVLAVAGIFGFNPFAPKPRTILNKSSGLLKPGEMCLVLGRPGSGCSTFLKSIANQRDSYMAVNGNVEYAGVGWKEMHKLYAGELLYNSEDDEHLPTLTVAQTIRFALSTKTPKKRIPGVSNAQFREEVLNLLLSMLNIKHTANTIVGDSFTRGVSGGERKRVSIAEQFCSGAALCSWDNSTRGLDASTALDYAKSLRLLTDITQQTTFVSLYQAGEGIYDQFDKIMVINEGRVVYFGPAKEARAYMISLGYKDLPRQTSADYLTGCTDVNERQFAEGKDETSVPNTPEDMEKAYLESEIHARMMREKDEFKTAMEKDNSVQQEFRQAVREQKRKGVGKKSPYTVNFFTQVMALVKRQFQLKSQDRFGIYTSYATSIVIALIVGSVYYQLPESASGAFSRGGLLFIGLLFNALTSFSELPSQMMGRPIMYKQVGYRMYRPGALAVAQTVADIPFTATNIFFFTIILYFMGGLYRSAGAYFTFYLMVYMSFMTMSAFFRTLGVATKSYDVAARLASLLISTMVVYAGYMIPVYAMKRWLFWLFYLNPLSYGYEAIFANEFGRINLLCDNNYIVPRNIGGLTKYPAQVGANQLCQLSGATAGQESVSGTAYMEAGFQYYSSHIWRNLGILIGFFIFFLILQIIFMEFLQQGANQLSVVVFAKENADLKKRNERLAERREAFNAGRLEQDLSGLRQAEQPFTWEHLNYTVPVPGGSRQLLNDVFGYVKPGSLTALMGASGAGKTTLLDVLAARKNVGVISGDVLMNGRPIDVSFARGCAYAEQQDVHEWTTTVREALRYSAYLRQPQEVPIEEKNDYVEDIIELLELQDLADGMIGFPGYGLSVEARKRLTIGVELAAKPDLLLFLDEPTSGLDGQSAYNIVRFLRKLAGAGQKILCTIHQPNALLFQSFDRLLLLQRGGECVYFGDIGKDSCVLIDYLERNGADVPDDVNPAEFMLEAIGAGSRKRIGGDWGEKWRNSPELAKVKEEITALNKAALAKSVEEDNKPKEYATSFGFQFKTILGRTSIALWRNADYQWTRLFAHIAIALVVSLTFLRLGDSSQDLQYRIFAIFFATVMPALVLAQIEPQYIMSRNTFNREASSKMYSSTVFAASQMIAEMPYSVGCATAFFLLLYYAVGMQNRSDRAIYFWLQILVTEIYSVTLGQAVAALSPSIIIAALFNPFLLVLFSIFCGVTVTPANIQYFWREWMYPLDPFTRLISGLVSGELEGLQVVCTDSEYSVFPAPNGQTCSQWAGEYAALAGGYLNNPDSTGDCQYCPYQYGQVFAQGLGLDFNTRWRDFGIFVAYCGFNIIVLLLAARFLKWSKR